LNLQCRGRDPQEVIFGHHLRFSLALVLVEDGLDYAVDAVPLNIVVLVHELDTARSQFNDFFLFFGVCSQQFAQHVGTHQLTLPFLPCLELGSGWGL